MPETISQAFQALWSKLYGWLESGVTMLPNFALAVVVTLAFAYLSRLACRASRAGLKRFTDNDALASLVGTIARIAVLLIGVFTALSLLHLQKTVTSLLAGLGVVGLALGFAFQDIAANFISGAILAFRGPFRTGDIIEIDGYTGTVKDVRLRQTVLRTFDGLTVVLPNKHVFQNALTNYTRTDERRVDITVGVAYDSDLEQVRKAATEAVEELEGRDTSREIDCLFTGFGGSSIDLELRLWLKQADQRGWLLARSEAIIRVKAAFDAEGIVIPFPIRTLDFGAASVGGERLDAMKLAWAQSDDRHEAAE